MPKIFQKIFIPLFLLFLSLALLSFFLPNQKDKASAQVGGGLTCRKIIPIGEAMEKAIDFADDIYVQLQNIHKEVGNEIKTAEEVLNRLGKDAENCDFSLCEPKCIDIGPSFDFEVTILWFLPILKYPACVAYCEGDLGVRRICQGDPCPHFDQDIKQIDDYQNNILTFHNNLKKILYSETEKVEEDIMRTNETPDTKITQSEFVRRKLNLSREKFKACALTEPEWQLVKIGEFAPRLAQSCTKALKSGKLWPDEWPLACQKKCQSKPLTEECEECLCAQTSRLGQVECQIYKVCKTQCGKDPRSLECQLCICGGKSTEDCLKWICGSLANWSCCY